MSAIDRITWHVIPLPLVEGKAQRYAIEGEKFPSAARCLAVTPMGRVRSFPTMSGAIRVQDQLNAREHDRATAK